MSDRETAFKSIIAGDLFHATAPNGASLICRALEVTEEAIAARTVTSQDAYAFSRMTGVAEPDFGAGKVSCTIDSVAALPHDMRETLLGLDRIYADKTRRESHPLSDAERRALVFAAQYYPANALPSEPSSMDVDRKPAPAPRPEDYDRLTGDEIVDLILVNYLIPANRT